MSEQDGGTTTTAEAGAGQEQGKEQPEKKAAPAKGGKPTDEALSDVAREFGIRDLDADDPKDRMFVGIITKLRGSKRELNDRLESTATELAEVRGKLQVFERQAKEADLITSALGTDKVLGDEAKFRKWAGKLSQGETWEADFVELVKDFAVAKPGSGDGKPADGKAPGEGGGKDARAGARDSQEKAKPYVPRMLRGKEVPSTSTTGTATPPTGPLTPLQRMEMQKQDPEGYEALRSRRRFGG